MLTFLSIVMYLLVAVVGSYLFYRRDVKSLSAQKRLFKKHSPFLPYGDSVVEFQYIFQHDDNIVVDVATEVVESIKQKADLTTVETVEFSDTDKKLSASDKREFSLGTGKPTMRGSQIHAFLYHDQYGQMQNIQWWILVNNPIKRSKVAIFLLFSFVTFPFRLWPYLKGTFNIAAYIRDPYQAFYEDLDLIMQIRAIHEVIINSLVDSLESRGVDTSDLKTQKAQSMNINVSGGKATFGNVMQGAMNSVSKSK
jgi:hypothetical protein